MLVSICGWVNLKTIFHSDIFCCWKTKAWSWIMLWVVMNVLCFVNLLLMVCWNQHMASVEMYIFNVNPVLMTCWNICVAWLFASKKPVNSSFRGNPCLITKLYFWNTKCYLCGACESHMNFMQYFFGIVFLVINDV